MKSLKILIAGGSGFIGRSLTQQLRERGHTIQWISRFPRQHSITWNELLQTGLPDCDAVINVTGKNILDPTRRWNTVFEEEIKSSRIGTTKTLVNAILKHRELNNSPKKAFTYLAISGINYYKNVEDDPADEQYITEKNGPVGNHYMGQFVQEWEAASEPLDLKENNHFLRRVIFRSGVVLGKNGGIFQSLKWPFWFGLGGPLGNGKQLFPWIHIHDLIWLINFALENDKIRGIMNVVAPDIITNAYFTKVLGHTMHRPTYFSVPSFILKAIFGEERCLLLLKGPLAYPEKAIKLGYQYKFDRIEKACRDLLSKP